jgi:uncharacterized protein YybS (DUF2232 family)
MPRQSMGEVPAAVDKVLLRSILVTTAVLSLPVLLPGGLGWLHSVTPLPVFYYLMQAGFRQGSVIVAGGLLLTTVLALIVGTAPVLLVTLVLAPLGYVLAWTAQRRETPLRSGVESIILLSGLVLVLWVVSGIFSPINYYTALTTGLDQGLIAARDLYRQSAQTEQETLQEIEAAFSMLRVVLPKVLPSLFFIMVIGTVWQNMIAGNWLLKKNTGYAPWPSFHQWRLPDWLVWGVVLAGITSLLLSGALNILALNLLLILGVLYFFQGLAVTGSLLVKWSVPPLLQAVIYFLFFFQVYGIFLLIILGLIDVWVDFRKSRTQEE